MSKTWDADCIKSNAADLVMEFVDDDDEEEDGHAFLFLLTALLCHFLTMRCY